ncbi:MAG: hypothetical protein AAFQ02_09235 [Bacteroidota bacterium]
MANIITKPKVDIAADLLDQLKEVVAEQGQVVVHCVFRDSYGGSWIRIWSSTFLFDHFSDHRSTLVHAERITLYPQWTITRQGDNFFTLIFTGLPDNCAMFDLVEDCNGSNGAFEVMNIHRNSSDVYYVQFG